MRLGKIIQHAKSSIRTTPESITLLTVTSADETNSTLANFTLQTLLSVQNIGNSGKGENSARQECRCDMI
jgi:hypothetical protein